MANLCNGVSKAENNRNIEAVFSLLHEPPSIHGFNRTTWRIEDLKSMLGEKGISVSIHNIRKIIRNAGYRWRKARIVLTSRDPHYREKLDQVQNILSNLQSDEAFFSVDEYGPFAVKIQGGRSYALPGRPRTVPQWQKSKGCLMMMAALELSSNQITHFYTDKKNTDEVIKIVDILRCKYGGHRKIYISWDAASWHMSKRLRSHIDAKNEETENGGYPLIELAPLPAGAQFLNVIESVFSGMARAIIHNSDYPDVDTVKKAIDRHFSERNKFFKDNPKRAGNKIWGKERSQSRFSPSNNCKDPRYR